MLGTRVEVAKALRVLVGRFTVAVQKAIEGMEDFCIFREG